MLSLVNFVLFFVLGFHIFIDFTKAIYAQTVNPYIWIGNHSIRSFVVLSLDRANEYSGLAQMILLTITVACIFLIILRNYQEPRNGIDSYLLLACTIGASLVPSVSHDYKLSIITPSVAIVFSDIASSFGKVTQARRRLFLIALTFIFSFAYTSTLFSFTNKPWFLKSNCPALLIMLLMVTFFALMSNHTVADTSEI